MSSLQRREDFIASNLFRCYASNIFSEISQFNSARSITFKNGGDWKFYTVSINTVLNKSVNDSLKLFWVLYIKNSFSEEWS